MGIQIGNSEVTNIQVGNTPVTAVYAGSTLIWPTESWKTVWEAETIYKFKVSPTNSTTTSTQSGYLSTITNPITSGLLKAGKKVRITLADYSSTTTERYTYAGTTYSYSMSNSSLPDEYTYEFDIPTTTGYNYVNLRIDSENSKAYVNRIYFDVKSDGTADILFYGYALRGSGSTGKCYGPAVKVTKVEQLI